MFIVPRGSNNIRLRPMFFFEEIVLILLCFPEFVLVSFNKYMVI